MSERPRPDGRRLKMGLNPWPDLRERLLSRLIIQADGCVIWTGQKFPTGYGSINAANGRTAYVHRLVYEMFVGPIPAGYQIDHLCRVRACASPAHLEAVTQRENLRRQWAHMREVRRGIQ